MIFNNSYCIFAHFYLTVFWNSNSQVKGVEKFKECPRENDFARFFFLNLINMLILRVVNDVSDYLLYKESSTHILNIWNNPKQIIITTTSSTRIFF